MAASTSHSCQNSFLRKRSNQSESDNEGPHLKAARELLTYHYVLQEESAPPTDEDTESIYSLQDKSTDLARDSPDLSYSEESIVYTIGGSGDYSQHISQAEEYEPASLSEKDNSVSDFLSSASDGDEGNFLVVGCEVLVLARDEDTWADSSSTSSDEPSIDPELSLRDYWSCVQCKATNNNPMFRYCERCFKIRKNFFPPRPKQKKKKKGKKQRNKETSSREISLCDEVVPKTNSTFVNSNDKSNDKDPSLCETCLIRPKDGIFVHGRKLAHMYCCYQCSKKVWKNTRRCPICNCKVSQVLKVIS